MTLTRLSDNPTSDLSEAIIREILVGTYMPGAKLREVDLAARFNVGRSLVREALRRLEERGIAVLVANAGMSVVRIGRREYLESSAARLALETQTASEAARHIDDGGVRILTGLVENQEAQVQGSEEPGDGFGRAATDTNFHRAIAQASGNAFILRLLENNIFFVNRLFQMEQPGLSSRAALAVEEHREIALAIAQRDPEVAALKMRRHLTRSTQWYLEQLEQAQAAISRRAGPRRLRTVE